MVVNIRGRIRCIFEDLAQKSYSTTCTVKAHQADWNVLKSNVQYLGKEILDKPSATSFDLLSTSSLFYLSLNLDRDDSFPNSEHLAFDWMFDSVDLICHSFINPPWLTRYPYQSKIHAAHLRSIYMPSSNVRGSTSNASHHYESQDSSKRDQ